MGHETRLLSLSKLLINTENPRFEMVGNQREAINVMVENQKNKLVKLAQDIVENGLNPSDLVIVTNHEKINNKFNVLEGNRRIATLKLLHNTDLISEKHKTLLNKFRKMSLDFKKEPIKEVMCVVFNSENEANRWIKLKHTGENEGIGTVTWDPQQKRRFEELFEGRATYALQIIDFLQRDEGFDDKLKKNLGKVPSSSLQRLLSDPDVRSVIGLETDDGKIISNLIPDEIRKPLTKIISDLLRDDFTVKEIYYKDDRENYIETFKVDDLPDKSAETVKWELVSPKPPSKKIIPNGKKKRSKKLSIARNTIIPKSCIIHISQPRINKIYRELKDLDLRYFVNSGAITFRVFFELSMDAFSQKFVEGANRNEKLANKTQKVTKFLTDNKHSSKHEVKPINTAVSNPNSIFSVNTFNAYVHNEHYSPLDNDLKVTWDNIEPVIVKIWELM